MSKPFLLSQLLSARVPFSNIYIFVSSYVFFQNMCSGASRTYLLISPLCHTEACVLYMIFYTLVFSHLAECPGTLSSQVQRASCSSLWPPGTLLSGSAGLTESLPDGRLVLFSLVCHCQQSCRESSAGVISMVSLQPKCSGDVTGSEGVLRIYDFVNPLPMAFRQVVLICTLPGHTREPHRLLSNSSILSLSQHNFHFNKYSYV